MTSLTSLLKSTSALEVISPVIRHKPVFTTASHATLLVGSAVKSASKTASLMERTTSIAHGYTEGAAKTWNTTQTAGL